MIRFYLPVDDEEAQEVVVPRQKDRVGMDVLPGEREPEAHRLDRQG